MPTRAREASISSCVKFLDRRKESLFSTGDAATLGSCRTVQVESLDRVHRLRLGVGRTHS